MFPPSNVHNGDRRGVCFPGPSWFPVCGSPPCPNGVKDPPCLDVSPGLASTFLPKPEQVGRLVRPTGALGFRGARQSGINPSWPDNTMQPPASPRHPAHRIHCGSCVASALRHWCNPHADAARRCMRLAFARKTISRWRCQRRGWAMGHAGCLGVAVVEGRAGVLPTFKCIASRHDREAAEVAATHISFPGKFGRK